MTKAGEKGVVNLTRLAPLVGGPIGAAVDVVSCRTIAPHALATFDSGSVFQVHDRGQER